MDSYNNTTTWSTSTSASNTSNILTSEQLLKLMNLYPPKERHLTIVRHRSTI